MNPKPLHPDVWNSSPGRYEVEFLTSIEGFDIYLDVGSLSFTQLPYAFCNEHRGGWFQGLSGIPFAEYRAGTPVPEAVSAWVCAHAALFNITLPNQ